MEPNYGFLYYERELSEVDKKISTVKEEIKNKQTYLRYLEQRKIKVTDEILKRRNKTENE